MPSIATRLPDFTLRRAKADDAGLVLAFMHRLGAFQKMADEITATEASLRRLLAEGLGEAVIGYLHGAPVAFVFYMQTSSAFTGRSGLFIDAILVDAGQRQLGLGKVLMEFMAQETRVRGGEMLEWGCLDWNEGAIAFYRRMGAYCLDIMRVYRMSPEDIGRHANGFNAQAAREPGSR